MRDVIEGDVDVVGPMGVVDRVGERVRYAVARDLPVRPAEVEDPRTRDAVDRNVVDDEAGGPLDEDPGVLPVVSALTASGDVTLTPRSSGPVPIMITAE